jgi:hypothetical protein
MQTSSAWTVDAWKILTRNELARVVADLKTRADRLATVRLNLALVRLACCCGLRVGRLVVCGWRTSASKTTGPIYKCGLSRPS